MYAVHGFVITALLTIIMCPMFALIEFNQNYVEQAKQLKEKDQQLEELVVDLEKVHGEYRALAFERDELKERIELRDKEILMFRKAFEKIKIQERERFENETGTTKDGQLIVK